MQTVPLRPFPPGRYELDVIVSDRLTRATATGTRGVLGGVWGKMTVRLGRGVAQPGRALGSGPRGRRFKSFRPDQSHPQNGPQKRAILLYGWFR